MKPGIKHSQLGRDLSRTLWELVHIKVKGDPALESEEAAAAVLMEDRLLCQIRCFAEEHQQVSKQKPDNTARERVIRMLRPKYVHVFGNMTTGEDLHC